MKDYKYLRDPRLHTRRYYDDAHNDRARLMLATACGFILGLCVAVMVYAI